jgi:hypothetical protein
VVDADFKTSGGAEHMRFFRLYVGSTRLAWLLAAAMTLLGTSPARGQRVTSVLRTILSVALEPTNLEAPVRLASETNGSSAAAKGAGIGLLIGALAGVAVGAMIESGNEGGSPEIRKKYKGFGYAVFIPTGAVVGAVAGGIIGARRN